MRRTQASSSSSLTSAVPQFSLDKLTREARHERFVKEYSKLSTIDTDPRVNFTTSVDLSYLNRYSNILANEQTLFPPSKEPAVYINANRMPFDTPHTLIASQAPISDEGLIPWWHVICSYKISLVMMLTREVENHVPKADRYWPREVNQEERYGPYRVVLESEEHIPELQLKVRQLSVALATRKDSSEDETKREAKEKNEQKHRVTQLQYLGWPDHGIPSSTVAFRKMMERLEQHPTDAPVIVHCSAGIGRTGTLIGYYAVKQCLATGSLTDRSVYEVVGAMKRSRRGMVQRFDQYNFIYQCLLEELESRASASSASL
ncbi:tyrosine specific protein phosphatase, putative [Bodo saltans]|uniref:Tyrosine specific protein phosphatase, putative n=1 Tax=Bodo saltans TaxID=75058 RepID=A0A0S4JR53_BODSA|nr:tyrosine specific protein phosphatase, putative [Bodo saltans]|eukprot:CUG93248.1 tyrosine specific protein phosphatase, putative [Bodo saltans]